VLALLNIVGKGMIGEPYESDVGDMDPARTAETILRNKNTIVGIKTAHFAKPGWTAIDRAVDAGRRANVPVMVDDKIFTNSGRTTKEELLDHLRPGDIHTHMYNDRQIELIDRFTAKSSPGWQRRGVAACSSMSATAGVASSGPSRSGRWRGDSCPIPSAQTFIRAR
jgi:hypothetical protein